MKRISKLMMVCFMAAVMMMTVGCKKEEITPIVPEGWLPGLFSVSATKQVHFSQGNLQYQASTNTWRFAEHQYDYVGTQTADRYGYYGGNVSGSDNSNISSTYSGWIDLFGWGTGDNPTLRSMDYADFSTFVDWGCNPISNGGNAAHLWRTLTSAEWYYLLEGRPNASSKFAAGNINGVGGLIILPDNWTQPSECALTSGFAPDWTLNSYTLAQWEQMPVQSSCLQRANATPLMSNMQVYSAYIGRPIPAMRVARS
ncbi:MAG: hypothetical protein IK126_00870 [Bacteroidales bacterium]|nr:hypothetical protein [Bacteroidales bacterium]